MAVPRYRPQGAAQGRAMNEGACRRFLSRWTPLALFALFALPGMAQTTATWADPAKVLRVMIPVAETGFDPQASQDNYSNTIISAIFDTLYEWDYLARPHRLVPRVAEAMPEISADGLTWTIRLKKGIVFADDAAFK